MERVALVDDNNEVLEALSRILVANPSYAVDQAFDCARRAAGELVKAPPDIVLLDVRMPGMDGVECLHRVRAKLPDTRIILYTALGAKDVLHHALVGGANGLVQKAAPMQQLLEVMNHCTATGMYLPHGTSIRDIAAEAGPRIKLTAREKQCLKLLALGRGNKEIANELGLARQSVDNLLSKLYRKLGCHNASGALALAFRLGLIVPPPPPSTDDL